MGDFFISKNDVRLADNILAQSADLWIKTENSKGVGTIDSSTPSSTTLTDTTKSWANDELVGLTLVIDKKEYVIAGNTSNTITFDSTSESISDGDYSYRVMNVEEFMGYSSDVKMSVNEDKIEFKDGIPRKKIREDLLERTIEGGFTLRVPSFGIWKAIFNMKDDSDSTEYIGKSGSNPGENPFYELLFRTINVSNKKITVKYYQVQLSVDGDIDFSGEDYKVIPVKFSVTSDPIREDANSVIQNENYFEIRIEK